MNFFVSVWLKLMGVLAFWHDNLERKINLALPVPLSGASEAEYDKPLLTPSLEGEYGRSIEVRRQLLLKDFVPEQKVDYWAALNRHTLEETERIAVDARTDEEISLGINNPRGVNIRDLEIQNAGFRTSSDFGPLRTAVEFGPSLPASFESEKSVITKSWEYDDRGEPLVGYVPERVMSTRQPAPRWYNFQTYINALDMLGLPVVEHFGEAPILGMEDIREVLETREMIQLLNRIKEAIGNYPSLEEMGILLAHEVVCKDQVIRAKTTTEHLGYDEHHADDSLQTVEKHNAFVGLLKSVTVQQAQIASDEGDMVLWNAGETGKHFIVSCDQEAM